MGPLPSASDFLQAGRRAAAWTGRATLDLLLPPHCLTCEQPVGAPGQFCPACFRATTFIAAPCCDACGLPFGSEARGGLDGLCEACKVRRPPWGRGRAALLYDDQARRLLLPFKYGDRTETARALAALMARAGASLWPVADLIVPVPLHRRRLIARRYNQSALLAQALSRLTNRPVVVDALRRVRPTRPLAGLSPLRREAALSGAIVLNPARQDRLVDARILLIDDIFTTGATLDACTRCLLSSGVGGVDVLAAARVPDWKPE